MSLIDRRLNGSGKSAPNRKKFIDRYKRQIKKSIEKSIGKKNVTDTDNGIDVGISRDSISEPDYQYDPKTGRKTTVNSGNDRFSKGDTAEKPPQGQGSGSQASDSGEGEDEFTFTLTKEEFLDLYFEDMELPNFIKENIKGSDQFKLKRAGYTREGIPTRMNSRKTLETAMARRIAAKAQGKKKPLYLDDSDVRYDNIVKKPFPITQAVMFCVMDVSGSMEERDKMIAKKFFILLYLFLNKCYDKVEVRFIRHTHDAEEVNEEEFFYGRKTGGTVVSNAFHLVNEIIDAEIDLEHTNVYISQASDGDNWSQDSKVLADMLLDTILPKVQYMAYIQTREPHEVGPGAWYPGVIDIYTTYDKIKEENEKLNCQVALEDKDVYPVLRKLFEKATS